MIKKKKQFSRMHNSTRLRSQEISFI